MRNFLLDKSSKCFRNFVDCIEKISVIFCDKMITTGGLFPPSPPPRVGRGRTSAHVGVLFSHQIIICTIMIVFGYRFRLKIFRHYIKISKNKVFRNLVFCARGPPPRIYSPPPPIQNIIIKHSNIPQNFSSLSSTVSEELMNKLSNTYRLFPATFDETLCKFLFCTYEDSCNQNKTYKKIFFLIYMVLKNVDISKCPKYHHVIRDTSYRYD